jgi:hypothetical protein
MIFDRCVGLRPNLLWLPSVPGPDDPGSSCIGLRPEEVANPSLVFVTADIIAIVGNVALAQTRRLQYNRRTIRCTRALEWVLGSGRSSPRAG